MDTTKKKRGAPPGNKNALKYGLYSRLLTKEEHREWKSAARGQLHPEINLFRVLIARTALLLKPVGENTAASFHESLSMLFAVSMAVARLNSFYRTNEKLHAASDDGFIEFFKSRGFTQEEIDKEIYGTDKRGRGGQMGNTNALRHGFYASIFKPEEIRKLDKIEKREIDEEIALIRTLIKRTVASMFNQSELNLLDYLKALRVITYAGSCVEKLERTKRLVFLESTGFEKIFEDSLKEIHKELGTDHSVISRVTNP